MPCAALAAFLSLLARASGRRGVPHRRAVPERAVSPPSHLELPAPHSLGLPRPSAATLAPPHHHPPPAHVLSLFLSFNQKNIRLPLRHLRKFGQSRVHAIPRLGTSSINVPDRPHPTGIVHTRRIQHHP